jgi:hypothetical protein
MKYENLWKTVKETKEINNFLKDKSVHQTMSGMIMKFEWIYDIDTMETYTAEDLVTYIHKHLTSKCKFMIGGGSLADINFNRKFSEIKDIDIFFESYVDLHEFQRLFRDVAIVTTTQNAVTYKTTIV